MSQPMAPNGQNGIDVDKFAEFVELHYHCVLCGTELDLKHQPMEKDHKVREEAHCPSCHLRIRAIEHPLN